MRMKSSHLVIFACLAMGVALAQGNPPPPAQPSPTPQHEGELAADFRHEHEHFSGSCVGFKSPFGCLQTLFTDHPLHIAVGSIAPQNGFAAGLALVTHKDLKHYYLKWDFDAVGSSNASWRAGGYMKIIPVKEKPVIVVHGAQKGRGQIVARPLFTIYAQAISLNKLGFFGLGPSTSLAGRSFYGMQETIVGTHAIVPIPASGKLNLSIEGEVNGRFVDIRPSTGQDSPPTQQIYTPVTAPGLASQPGFIQFGEGLRIKPSLGEHLKLNYLATLQEFIAPGDSTFSFRRFNLDLGHEIPLIGIRQATAKDFNGPDGCGTSDSTLNCPSIQSSFSADRYGTLDLRFLLTESIASGGSVVPFYFQPTLGGSNINGIKMLPSFQDYRFRAPNMMLFHAGLDHSIWGPFGLALVAESGKVALTRGDIGFNHLSHSFGAGLSLRAGGLPFISLMFAWGGHEGNHTIANVNTSLLGGSARPSLF
jgi:hypothetical protein